MKKFLAVLLTAVMAIACFLGLTACGQEDVASIKEKGTLVVGVTVYKPMDYIDEEGEWTGFDAEMANALGERLGVTVQFVIIKWANKVPELTSGNIDCIWNGMTMSAELDKNIDFSCSYAENRQVAVVRTTELSNYTTINSIKNAAIAVEQGSAGDKQATNTVQGTNIVRVKDQVGALTEVSAGTSDVALIDLTMAQSVVGNGAYANLSIVDVNLVSFGHEEFAVGVRTGSNLKQEIDTLFKDYYKNGKLAELATKYGGIALNNTKLGAL